MTRRQALALSGSAAAGLALVRVPGWAHGAPLPRSSLPIPALIEPRDGEVVPLVLQNSRHRFGTGAMVPSAGISGSYLGPVVRVRSGQSIAFRVENRLKEETTLHWHGLLVPSEVDGGPHNVIVPGAVWTPELKMRQPAATTWFHPHLHGSTARQVYGGLAGMLIVSDGDDNARGLPDAYGIDDLPIVLQDKRFGRDGSFAYDPTMMDVMHGFRGDTLLVNGAVDPIVKVPAGFVRLRLLNAANARNFDLRFADRRPFFVIAGDASYLPEPVEVRRLLIAPAERYEILADFSDGRTADLVTGPDPHGGMAHGMMMQMGRRQAPGVTERFMRIEPDPALAAAVTRLPRTLVTLPDPDVRPAAQWRTFVLDPMQGMEMAGMSGRRAYGSPEGRDPLDHAAAQMMGINGRPFSMGRVDVTAKLGTTEIWEVVSDGMAHPFHLHGASFRVLSNSGRKPSPEQAGWKDVVLVEDQAEILVRFDNPAPPRMPFMYHCHILEHEDHGMMGQLAVV